MARSCLRDPGKQSSVRVSFAGVLPGSGISSLGQICEQEKAAPERLRYAAPRDYKHSRELDNAFKRKFSGDRTGSPAVDGLWHQEDDGFPREPHFSKEELDEEFDVFRRELRSAPGAAALDGELVAPTWEAWLSPSDADMLASRKGSMESVGAVQVADLRKPSKDSAIEFNAQALPH